MSTYNCEKCEYCTRSKYNLRRHQKNEFGCAYLKKNNEPESEEDLNLSNATEDMPTKKQTSFTCNICNKTFTRKDKLKQHIETTIMHKRNLDIYNSTMKNVKINCDNNTTNIVNNSMVLNINYTQPISGAKIYDYMHTDINDLTLFEQYRLFCHNASIGCSPIKTFLDNFQLNPEREEYHNVRYQNVRTKNVDIYDGQDWCAGNFDNIQNVIDGLDTLLCSIFNRFRIFLGRRSHVYGIKNLYNGMKCKRGIKKTNEDVRLHIHNKGERKQAPIYTDKNIPANRDHQVWKSLSKTFEWDEVVRIITIMDRFKISFDDNLAVMRDKINDKISRSRDPQKSEIFFAKFKDRISYFICEYMFPDRKNVAVSSASDELDEYHKYYDDRNKIPYNDRNHGKQIERKHLDNHNEMSSNVRHHGARKIGRKFGTSEED